MKMRTWLAALIAIASCSNGRATGAGSGSSTGSGVPPTPASDPEISAMAAEVNASNIASSVAKLASFTTRNTCSDDGAGSNAIGGARDWIKTQFAAIPDLSVTLDSFSFTGCSGGAVMRENVVAWKLGAAHPDRLIVIGGHYDSRTLDVIDGTSPAPGANDSGSQTSLVLEVARVMAGATFDSTVVFVAFAGEEQGLLGSRSFAASYKKYFDPNATIEAMLNCDIVGGDSTTNDAAALRQLRLFSPGTPREISTPMGTTDDTSPSRGLMRFIATVGGAYVPSMSIVPVLREDRPGRGGDHEAFIEQGIPGVRFIETNESPAAGTVASHQHSPNDQVAYVTPEYTARIAQLVLTSAASLARAPAPPPSNSVSGNSAGSVRVTFSAPAGGSAVDHYVIAGRPVTENFYRKRALAAATATDVSVTPADLGLGGVSEFFVSYAAVDAMGHESMFAYPEYRCDPSGCVVQPGSLDPTAKN